MQDADRQSAGSAEHRGASRPSGSILYAQTLILIFTALFLGSRSGGAAGLDDRVQEFVKDVARAERAGSTAARIDARTDEVLRTLVDSRVELYDVLERYGSTAAELHSVLKAAASAVGAGQRDLLGLRFELRDAMTEDEWNNLFDSLRDDEIRMVQKWR